MRTLFALVLLICPTFIFSQNVGIGNPTPAEKLDVNGNINVTGTIKANGVDGTAGQVLMKNNSGNLAWGSICDYKNIATFITGSGSWVVPAGVTKVWVELWGGGASGSQYVGGGGGAYVSAIIDIDPVTPGSINYTVGAAGTGGSGGNASASNVSYTFPVGLSITAGGGLGGSFTPGTPGIIGNAFGGDGSAMPASFTSYVVKRGAVGRPYTNAVYVTPAATYEVVFGGDGGDGGNTTDTGGKGNKLQYNLTSSTSLLITNALGNGIRPGGGGGSGLVQLSTVTHLVGSNGASGMVIIHY